MGEGAAQPPLHPTALSRRKSAAPWSATVTSGEGSHAKAAQRVSFFIGRHIVIGWLESQFGVRIFKRLGED